MGRKQNQGWKRWQNDYSAEGSAAWSGYRSESWHQGHYGRPNWEAARFPTFENMVPNDDQTPAPPNATSSTSHTSAGAMVRSVQKQVNLIRKCETKIRRNAEDAKDLGDKWAAFQAEMQASYVKKRARYHEKCDKLARRRRNTSWPWTTSWPRRRRNTSWALDEALLDLQKAFLAEEEEAEPPKEDMSTEALAEWERLTRAPEPSASGLSALMEAAFKGSRELKKAAREKLMAKLANHEDSPAGTPPRRETRAPVLTPPPRETARRPSGPEVENGQVAKEITELITDDEEDSVGDLKPPESPGEPPRREHRIGGTIHRAPDNITSNGLFRCVPVASAQRNPRIVRLEAASSETRTAFSVCPSIRVAFSPGVPLGWRGE